MKASAPIAAFAITLMLTGMALADVAPKPSKAYAGNYRTLMNDQNASTREAACIATGHDYAAAGKRYDRLGFTKADIAATRVSEKRSVFSARDRRTVSKIVSIAGTARSRGGNDGWKNITLRCGEIDGVVRAIELVARK